MTEQTNSGELLAMTARIVAAHVTSNSVPAGDLPGIIGVIYHSLSSLGVTQVVPERAQPAVPVKKSVTPDYVVCLDCGKKLKMLKRHLMTAHDMTTEQYCERWSLPADHPMVAANYALHRSDLAKKIGLGTRTRQRTPVRAKSSRQRAEAGSAH